MKGDNIAARLLEFAAGVLESVAEFPRTVVGNHVARQLARCGTSGGANYEEARRAESGADFAHKIDMAAKEVGEAVYWLRLAERVQLTRSPLLRDLIGEGTELVAILRSSARTVRTRQARQSPPSGSRLPAPGSQFPVLIDQENGEARV